MNQIFETLKLAFFGTNSENVLYDRTGNDEQRFVQKCLYNSKNARLCFETLKRIFPEILLDKIFSLMQKIEYGEVTEKEMPLYELKLGLLIAAKDEEERDNERYPHAYEHSGVSEEEEVKDKELVKIKKHKKLKTIRVDFNKSKTARMIKLDDDNIDDDNIDDDTIDDILDISEKDFIDNENEDDIDNEEDTEELSQ